MLKILIFLKLKIFAKNYKISKVKNLFFTDPHPSRSSLGNSKPRLVRQSAFQDETQDPTSPKLNVRFLPTIPSAPDSMCLSSVQMDDENEIENKEQQEENVQIQEPAENSTNSSSLSIKSKPP